MAKKLTPAQKAAETRRKKTEACNEADGFRKEEGYS